ncbi:MAG: hypothetical protein KAH07_00585 [Flavobacteriaceae bacterium]|nr:hypothetical protein [Flavobacteriaceae bacterium]
MKDIYKIAKIGTAVLGVLGVILLVRVIAAGEAVELDIDVQSSVVDPFITFTFLMMGLTTVLAVGFSLFGLVKDLEALKKASISLGVLVVFFLIAYALADDLEVTNKFGVVIENGEAGSVSKNSGALIIFSYFLGFVGLATVVWGSVKEMLSK